MAKKGKGIETVNLLPKPIIQHIQSFLNGKEAARTSLLSKPWYNAWLTRPTLDFDEGSFNNWSEFEEFTTKTMKRYQDLNLKIDCFRLLIIHDGRDIEILAHDWIVDAIKIGATDLELDLPSITLPREVFESNSIVRLSITHGIINGIYMPCCSRLKSLSVKGVPSLFVRSDDDVLRNIMSSCCASIEELSLSLSLSFFRGFTFSRMYPHEFRKLRSLFLDSVFVDDVFFIDFATKFPCLKDLSLVYCNRYTRIDMASTSLESITFEHLQRGLVAKYDVPNIRKFTYSGEGLPSLYIKGSSTREWEFAISIECCHLYAASWFLRLNRLLKRMNQLCRITLSLVVSFSWGEIKNYKVGNDIEVVAKPIVLENLRIESPSAFCHGYLVRLFGICRPKLITHYWLPESSLTWKENNDTLGIICNALCLDQNVFDWFGLKEVKVELYEEILADEWRPLVLNGPFDASKAPANKCKILSLYSQNYYTLYWKAWRIENIVCSIVSTLRHRNDVLAIEMISVEKVDEAREIIGVVKEKFSRNAEKWSEIEEGLSK